MPFRKGAEGCMATQSVSVGMMKAAQVGKAGGDFELVERDIPEPGPGQVRVKVEVCGICHSDVMVKDGLWPGLQYPRVPGHEVAGRVDALGEGVSTVRKGDRVGVGWHGGHDFVCDHCRRGDFAMCVERKVTGIDYDGGYAEYMVAPAEALAAIPDELPADEAGPFMCAGVSSMPCATPARGQAMWSRYRGSAALDIWVCNTLAKWASRPLRWDAAARKDRSQRSSARTITSIRRPWTRSLNCRNSVARA